MPLLIQSLSQDQASLLLSTLQTIYSLIFDAPEAIIRQVTSLVPNFLRLLKFEPSMVSWNICVKLNIGTECGENDLLRSVVQVLTSQIRPHKCKIRSHLFSLCSPPSPFWMSQICLALKYFICNVFLFE